MYIYCISLDGLGPSQMITITIGTPRVAHNALLPVIS